ncbi:hypothetical protein KSP39_PZI013541 [Platanthera zijinensis]|uniref:Acyl-coenzyme A thioesterase 13 n=1 Tax=Platanthera zijinensis TaxID=2320716 RepID=A0AAP0BD15_9ASPA
MERPQNSHTPPTSELPTAGTSVKRDAAARKWIEGILAKSPAAGSLDSWKGDLFDSTSLSGLRINFIGGGRALCSYRVHASVADEEGNLHLGAISTLIDDIGAAAIMSVVGEIKISVDFSISFFSQAKIGDEVEIEAKIVERRARLTMVAVELRHVGTNRLVATSRQWMSFSRALHQSNM